MAEITDQVIDFYNVLFERVFYEPFSARLTERRRRDAVRFQVLEAAGAASQSLERFFSSQRLTAVHVQCVLAGLELLGTNLTLEQIANPYTAPENIVEDLLKLPAYTLAMASVVNAGQEAVFRVALYSVVQALMQVGPMMAEWQNIGFPSTFELSRRVIARLNEISAQLDVLGKAGSEAADERYELQYRDYLSQRFYRVEAGTVRMTTNLSVDLRELFVMPNVLERPGTQEESTRAMNAAELMPLSHAREALAKAFVSTGADSKTREGVPLLKQVRRSARNVIVGAPGSGKSTFLEWLQLKVASAEQEFVIAGQQGIPLLLRVRWLDPTSLPTGSAMIEKATGSKDFAALMPFGWLDRQMSRGAVIFMLDGLDEVEPNVRDTYLLPWFTTIVGRYPMCAFIVSSRPVGYVASALSKLSFCECELLDFTEPQITEYARHWCTAVRLARNETLAEARREGSVDGDRIIAGFGGHPYIKSLARNPLMLSAICLVNYFEGGQLPKDRAVLYKLCVEGLLHNWDQRRGILSDFTFEEKVRASREVALHMQAHDRAEYESQSVQEVFCLALKDTQRAAGLLEHVRYRTGLLLERRPGIFAFAHLTFQEYLAARAIYEGNQSGIDVQQLIREHSDQRWQEVIALYCGIAPTPAAQGLIIALLDQTNVRAGLLAEAYLSAGPELNQDKQLRRKVMITFASAAGNWEDLRNNRFAGDEFAPIANEVIGCADQTVSHAYMWFMEHKSLVKFDQLIQRLRKFTKLTPNGAGDLSRLIHYRGDDNALLEVAENSSFYASRGPELYDIQAELAIEALLHRPRESDLLTPGEDATYVQALTAMVSAPRIRFEWARALGGRSPHLRPLHSSKTRPLLERLVERIRGEKPAPLEILDRWVKLLTPEVEPGHARPGHSRQQRRKRG